MVHDLDFCTKGWNFHAPEMRDISQRHTVQALSAAMKVERRLAQRIKGSSAAAGVKASDASRKHGDHLGFSRHLWNQCRPVDSASCAVRRREPSIYTKGFPAVQTFYRLSVTSLLILLCAGTAVPAESSESEEDEDLGRAGAIVRNTQPVAQAWSQAECGKARKRKKAKKRKLGNGQ